MDLTFADFLKDFDKYGKGEWITVYSNGNNSKEESSGFYSAIIPIDKISESLEDTSWDFHIGDGFPGFSFQFIDGKEIGTYSRCSEDGVEPLAIRRSFSSMKEGYWEILEEFRYYFNLYEDRVNKKYVFIDENGDDEDVVLISDTEVKIKAKQIKIFLAVKKMCLALFFDFNRFSEKTIEQLGIKECHDNKKGEDFVYSIGARNWTHSGDEIKSQGFLMGKKLIFGLENFKPTCLDKTGKVYLDFIIGIDDNGKEILHTCDESKLANYFGKNPGSPQFITPILFKKEVLGKYYSQPEKYTVEDGLVSCGMWSLRIDNNHSDFIMAFLGDLGHLPHKEQMHWRSCNLATKGKMSHVAWKRGFEAQFADPEQSDLFFKYKFEIFQKKWEKEYGWKLFLPLNKDDFHHLKTLRIPLTNEQKEFDEQVLSLTKIFIDSLNEKELGQCIGSEKHNLKGIDKFEAFILAKGIKFKGMIEFLRNLQEIRSSGVAHRKGTKYKKVAKYFSIGEKDLSKVFDDILIRCIWALNSLENHLLKDKNISEK